ncbi:hypothetical protein IGB42_01696 [Andreprevotia sp. IGB-42]|uniref:DUF1800 domain-containing protein n=1 Tax=Andreprevotia sp. IGB-42 TaxID=2497473 RepID=UPI0013567B48|nr:DUF1800 domain-containing protein [Andreprevotia sp. IGB-42]KAF0814016.1 hypothetical protein IGB42_01696 [Andreprevotia sp. IGB-42]
MFEPASSQLELFADESPASSHGGQTAALLALAATTLAACGGGGGGENGNAVTPTPVPNGGSSPTPVPGIVPPDAPGAALAATGAARFLAQASMGADSTQIARVQALGYAGWIDEQMALPQGISRCDWLVSKGYDQAGANNVNKNGVNGFDACVWRTLLSSPDTLRQRVTLALSEILVVSVNGLSGGWRQFSAANYLDILENNAFGNYRTLLQQVSTSAAMGEYLTYRGNVKYNASTGAQPDENYARELMQLFTVGLVQLNPDGTPKISNGKVQETYMLEDITGLARVFTGWEWDLSLGNGNTPDFQRRPMVQVASRHETGASPFLGSTVAGGLDGTAALTAALDILFAHPNIAPFISRQLIQRLVTSNPSPAYVQRVASIFQNDGSGVKGNLKAVIRTLLLDDEARNPASSASNSFGKLREPILRLTGWARAFGATSPSDAWAIGDTSDPGTRLGQSPLRASSVFNFFRPGYVPPDSSMAGAAMVAPEFQITNESSVIGYLNYMQTVISSGVGDVKGKYDAWLVLADDAAALLAQLNLLLAAGQLGSATLGTLQTALNSIKVSVATRPNRLYAAILMVMAAPEFLVQK